jgi:hypothetical protein
MRFLISVNGIFYASEIKIDGVVRASNQGYIDPGQIGPVSFMIAFPFPGEYTISLKNLSQKIEVQANQS